MLDIIPGIAPATDETSGAQFSAAPGNVEAFSTCAIAHHERDDFASQAGEVRRTERRAQIIRATTGILRSSTVSPQLIDSVPANTIANLTKAGHEWS